MIESALSPAMQCRLFSPLAARPRRRRSLDDVPPTLHHHRQRAKPHCNAARRPAHRSISPSLRSSSMFSAAPKQMLALLKSPWFAAAKLPFLPAISCFGASRTPVERLRLALRYKVELETVDQ